MSSTRPVSRLAPALLPAEFAFALVLVLVVGFADASQPIFAAWQAKGHSAELHVFNKGGHGFGMLQHGNSSDHWADEFFWWLQAQGFAKAVAAP